MNGTRRVCRLRADKVKFVLRVAGCLVLRAMSMVFRHPVDKAVWGDDFGAAGTAHFCAVRELREELGIIGPKKCCYVKLLIRVIEYKPGVFQWHTDVKHARAVIEVMGLDVETSKPAPTPEIKYCTRKQDSAGGLRKAEGEPDDEDQSAYRGAAGTLLHHTSDRPDIQFFMGRCMSGLSCPRVKHQTHRQVSCG